MNCRLLSLSFLIFFVSLASNLNFASAHSNVTQENKSRYFSSETSDELLQALGDLFELDIPVPIQILELDMKEFEHKELASFITKINQKMDKDIEVGDTLINFVKEEFNIAFAKSDQFQKHDLFLNLCLQIINQKQKSPICITAKEFYTHIEPLFAEKDRPNIKKIIEKFTCEESIIRDIAQIKKSSLRRSKINDYFKENRRKGAKERLDEIMIVNALYEN